MASSLPESDEMKLVRRSSRIQSTPANLKFEREDERFALLKKAEEQHRRASYAPQDKLLFVQAYDLCRGDLAEKETKEYLGRLADALHVHAPGLGLVRQWSNQGTRTEIKGMVDEDGGRKAHHHYHHPKPK